jgi:hypothetical protein
MPANLGSSSLGGEASLVQVVSPPIFRLFILSPPSASIFEQFRDWLPFLKSSKEAVKPVMSRLARIGPRMAQKRIIRRNM